MWDCQALFQFGERGLIELFNWFVSEFLGEFLCNALIQFANRYRLSTRVGCPLATKEGKESRFSFCVNFHCKSLGIRRPCPQKSWRNERSYRSGCRTSKRKTTKILDNCAWQTWRMRIISIPSFKTWIYLWIIVTWHPDRHIWMF